MKVAVNLFLLCCVSFYPGFTQINLVPNPSFEDTIPCYANTGPPQMPADLWFAIGSSDYFSEPYSEYCAYGNLGFSNPFGHQSARTDSAYCGFSTWGGFTSNWREYIEVELTNSLIAGKIYCISFYVSLADTVKGASNRIGAYISTDSIEWNDVSSFTIIPQIESNMSVVISDTANWVLVSDSMTAIGGEKFITIGNFYNDANTLLQVVYPSSNQDVVYYYIDDVSVIDCGWSGMEEPEQNVFTLYPNPCEDIVLLKLSNPVAASEITVVDLMGNVVLREISGSGAVTMQLEVSHLLPGSYFLKRSRKNGFPTIQKFHIIR